MNIVLRNRIITLIITVLVFLTGTSSQAQRHIENLDRGVIVIHTDSNSAYIGWRLLGTEPEDVSFNLYRQSGNKKPVKLNNSPITESTNFVDKSLNNSVDNSYFVKAIIKGKELEASNAYKLKANSPIQQYINIPLKTPNGYTPNDISVGDLDGDGVYEIVLHQTSRGIDSPSPGISGIPLFQAYKQNGEFLWEINLGKNIREGLITHNLWCTILTVMALLNSPAKLPMEQLMALEM